MIGGVTRQGGKPGLPNRVTLSTGVKFCHVNVSRWCTTLLKQVASSFLEKGKKETMLTRLAGVEFVIHQIRAKFTLAVALHHNQR